MQPQPTSALSLAATAEPQPPSALPLAAAAEPQPTSALSLAAATQVCNAFCAVLCHAVPLAAAPVAAAAAADKRCCAVFAWLSSLSPYVPGRLPAVQPQPPSALSLAAAAQVGNACAPCCAMLCLWLHSACCCCC